MYEVDANTVMHAAHVVERCLTDRRGPAQVMASMPSLRAESGDVRAQVAKVAGRVIAGRRRFRAVLGDVCPRHPLERARAYVLMSFAEAGHALPRDARDLPDAERIASRLQAIADEDERFAATHSIPDWLVTPFREAWQDNVDAVLRGLDQVPPRTLRANALAVGSREELLKRLAAEGVDAQPAQYASTAVHVNSTHDLFQTDAFRDGCFEQQDEASQLAILATAPPKGGKVLDLCCGSGGKTLGLASELGNRGVILASDIHEARVRELRQRLPRTGAHNVQPLHADGSPQAAAALESFAKHADRILIDAPCSGTGSWRRRPEARWNIDAQGLLAMQETQRDLLQRAVGWLRPGARLVYATCSLLPAENEQQIAWLLEKCPELEQVRLVEILGSTTAAPICDETGTWLTVRPDRHGCDGFFLSVLRKRRPSSAI